ncbi:MAG: hypothetical protein ACP5OX_01335 [Minisyncoccia bacterium]
MTIIYDYQNSTKIRRPIIYYSGRRYCFKKKKAIPNILLLKEYFGHIKLFVFLLGPVLVALVFWLILYGQNISLDYQIYKLKGLVKESEEKLAELQEELADAETISKINQWAKENHFVKVKNVSYLNLQEENLAQNTLLRF